MLLVIGSKAAEFHGYEVTGKGRKLDTDLVGSYDELVAYFRAKGCVSIVPAEKGAKIIGKGPDVILEGEITWPGSTSEELFRLATPSWHLHSREDNGFTLCYAGLEILYLLKMTHRFKKNSPHFLKTMSDIHGLRRKGVNTIRHPEFFDRRLKETLNYGHPKLKQSKEGFFTDTVEYTYDHDSIHETVKLNAAPAYTYFKEEQAEVFCSKELFFSVSKWIRLSAVYEESCVLALERSQIPHPQVDRRRSFNIALEKVCTSITSGWFREFAWEHYHIVQDMYDKQTEYGENYVDMFKRGFDKGLVKPFTKGMM